MRTNSRAWAAVQHGELTDKTLKDSISQVATGFENAAWAAKVLRGFYRNVVVLGPIIVIGLRGPCVKYAPSLAIERLKDARKAEKRRGAAAATVVAT